MHDNREKKPNALIHESSPYLLQHAYNPVAWVPFSPEAFETAKRTNRPLLISIGYSACHWCHVMEHESFEDPEVAALMNAHFVNVKVDREERPDVDALHMAAVQLMTGQGGWPLNCFVLPDGRPFYGGTYFPKQNWLNILTALSGLYANERGKVERYAHELTEGIRQTENIVTGQREGEQADRKLLKESVEKWKRRLDRVEGGPDKAPKFPLPSNYQFLLRYALLEKDEELLEHVKLTLTKMAFGGIYDQVHGGFARYSTDAMWKVPHFEKMLYDNAQLAALYTEAWVHTRNGLFRDIATDTLDFVRREWYNEAGFFYSAYDADSEGEEGKYYVWSREELRETLSEDYDIFSEYYEINEKGYWENGNYILMRKPDVSALMARTGMDAGALRGKMNACRGKLRKAAEHRVKPGLDDKTITAWNAMMCSACAHAWLAFGDERYREMALASMKFILGTLRKDNRSLFRTYKNGKARIAGFLDDYAFTIQACMACYLATQDEGYLAEGRRLCEFAMENFGNNDSLLLHYTGKDAEPLVARTTETSDNVIPASNSQMALNLFCLGQYFGITEWTGRAGKMLHMVAPELLNYGAGYSNWGCLALHLSYPYKEVALVGKDVEEKLMALYREGITNAILACSRVESGLPLLRDRHVEGKTMIYVCENRTCKLPVETVEEAIKLIE